ncbi:hypothetical protein ISCGN_003932 [Ixodes scapularis]
MLTVSGLGALELDSEATELRATEVTLGCPVEGVSDPSTPGPLLNVPIGCGCATVGLPCGEYLANLVVQAKSGTGKTCVFAVLALEAVDVGTNAVQEPSSAWGSMTVGPAEPLQDSLGGGGCRVGIHWVVFFDPRSSSGTVGRDASLAKSMGENVLDRKNAQERRGDDCAVDDGTVPSRDDVEEFQSIENEVLVFGEHVIPVEPMAGEMPDLMDISRGETYGVLGEVAQNVVGMTDPRSGMGGGGSIRALVTNFRQESQHLTKGTAVGYVEEIQDSAAIAVISEDASPTHHKTTTPSELDIDPSLPGPQRRQLTDLLAEFSECFATSSKVRQTAVAKHRIVTDDDALPVHRSPYKFP